MNICKYLITFFILFEIDFNKMRKQLLTDISDKIRLAYLPCTIDEQNLIRYFHKEVFQKESEFSFKHNQSFKVGTKLHLFPHTNKEKSTYSIFLMRFLLTYSVFSMDKIPTYSIFRLMLPCLICCHGCLKNHELHPIIRHKTFGVQFEFTLRSNP